MKTTDNLSLFTNKDEAGKISIKYNIKLRCCKNLIDQLDPIRVIIIYRYTTLRIIVMRCSFMTYFLTNF